MITTNIALISNNNIPIIPGHKNHIEQIEYEEINLNCGAE